MDDGTESRGSADGFHAVPPVRAARQGWTPYTWHVLQASSTSTPIATGAAAQAAPGLKARYLELQQEADFALWRARVANGEVRKAYAAFAAGQGQPPSDHELQEVQLLERDAEARYRELRAFLREHFC